MRLYIFISRTRPRALITTAYREKTGRRYNPPMKGLHSPNSCLLQTPTTPWGWTAAHKARRSPLAAADSCPQHPPTLLWPHQQHKLTSALASLRQTWAAVAGELVHAKQHVAPESCLQQPDPLPPAASGVKTTCLLPVWIIGGCSLQNISESFKLPKTAGLILVMGALSGTMTGIA